MRERGRLMQELPSSGVMASLMASEKRISAVLAPYKDRVSIAAMNGPESTVISGEKQAVEAILAQLESEGIKVKILKVSNAFHSHLVDPVQPEFEQIAKKLQYAPPQVPVFSSMRLKMMEEGDLDAAYWPQNLRNTVRFLAVDRTALRTRLSRIFGDGSGANSGRHGQPVCAAGRRVVAAFSPARTRGLAADAGEPGTAIRVWG